MTNRVEVAVVLLVVLIAAAACGGGGTAPAASQSPEAGPPVAQEAAVALQGDAAAGKELYATACQACHGPGGTGVQGLGKDMTESEFIAGLSDAELLAFIKAGRPSSDPLNTTGVDMPPKGGNPALTDQQLVDIIAYIRSIHQ